jgi:hypothetical protein
LLRVRIVVEAADPHLRDLVQRYCISYRILPEWGTDPQGQSQRIGFELALRAVANPDAPTKQEPPMDDPARFASHAALEEIARWILAGGEPEVCVAIDRYDGRVQHDPRRNGWVVELAAHVLHCGDVRRPPGLEQQRHVDEAKRRMASVGLQEG